MTKYLYWDKERAVKAYNLPGGYHGLVESKVSPMLVSGSYVGWMVQMMREMFVGGRLRKKHISPQLDSDAGLKSAYR